MIRCENIKDLKHAKEILDRMIPINKSIDLIPEDSSEYEMITERIGEQLCEVDEFFVGREKIISSNLINADLRMMSYWSYLKEEITFDKLLNLLRNNSSS
jgi:hypothetical protein